MEFPNLQTHCSFSLCKQIDFLPFTCDLCKKVFCLEHRTPKSHECTVSFSREKPQCPVCGQLMNVGRDEDPNEVISRHIDAGCPKETQLKGLRFPCKFAGCKNSELAKIICPYCNENFCVQHRQPDQHNCKPVEAKTAAAATAATAHKAREAWWKERFKQITSKLDALRQKSSDSKAKQLSLMKGKDKAIGAKNVPDADKLYLEVVFPFEKSIPSKWMYFNKNAPAGRALDEIADAGRIRNENNKAGARKLVLVDLKTGDTIRLDQPLGSLFEQGDLVMLEYEDNTKAGASGK